MHHDRYLELPEQERVCTGGLLSLFGMSVQATWDSPAMTTTAAPTDTCNADGTCSHSKTIPCAMTEMDARQWIPAPTVPAAEHLSNAMISIPAPWIPAPAPVTTTMPPMVYPVEASGNASAENVWTAEANPDEDPIPENNPGEGLLLRTRSRTPREAMEALENFPTASSPPPTSPSSTDSMWQRMDA